MLRCDLVLGEAVWERLAQGKADGLIQWNGGQPLAARVRIRGAHSRKFPRKSLQVDLPAGPLPDAPPKGHTVRRIHLNADYIDPTRMRSALSFGLFAQLGAPAPLCRHVDLTVSGERLGVYLALESVDSDFCFRRGWAPGSIHYAVNRCANFGLVNPFTRALKEPLETGYKPVEGASPGPLRRMLLDLNLASDQAFPRVAERWFDVKEYLRWLMVAVFVGNRDGFVHNYALYHDPDSGQFRIIPWDYDATWGMDIHGRPARLDRVPVGGWNKLAHRLLANSRFRRQYRRLFLAELDGPLAPDALLPQIDRMAAEVAPWIDVDRRDDATVRRFWEGVDGLKWWAEERRALLLQELDEL